MTDAIRIHAADNVATALTDLAAGGAVAVGSQRLIPIEPIARGHKLALTPIACGASVIKYGFPIGIATADIAAGAHVHGHNLATALTGSDDYVYAPPLGVPPLAAAELLPVIEAVMVAKLNEQMERPDG